MTQITVMGRSFELYSLTGKVITVRKRISSELYADLQPVQFPGCEPFTKGINITTVTRQPERIFLLDDKGREHALHLWDADISCREGQLMMVVWAMPAKHRRGPYIGIKNLSTGQAFFNQAGMKKLFRPPVLYYWGFVLIAFLAGLLVSGSIFKGLLIGLAATITGFFLRNSLGRMNARYIQANLPFESIG
jgi:hypothetical protein